MSEKIKLSGKIDISKYMARVREKYQGMPEGTIDALTLGVEIAKGILNGNHDQAFFLSNAGQMILVTDASAEGGIDVSTGEFVKAEYGSKFAKTTMIDATRTMQRFGISERNLDSEGSAEA